MGILNKIFSGLKEPQEEKLLPWIALSSVEQLDEIKENSKAKTQVVFKHSTRCGISRMVLKQFINSYSLTEKDIDLYYLDILNYRDVSNEIVSKFQVMHESPQLLVIKNTAVVAHASHGSVSDLNLEQFV